MKPEVKDPSSTDVFAVLGSPTRFFDNKNTLNNDHRSRVGGVRLHSKNTIYALYCVWESVNVKENYRIPPLTTAFLMIQCPRAPSTSPVCLSVKLLITIYDIMIGIFYASSFCCFAPTHPSVYNQTNFVLSFIKSVGYLDNDITDELAMFDWVTRLYV